jgi:hypothetical protein
MAFFNRLHSVGDVLLGAVQRTAKFTVSFAKLGESVRHLCVQLRTCSLQAQRCGQSRDGAIGDLCNFLVMPDFIVYLLVGLETLWNHTDPYFVSFQSHHSQCEWPDFDEGVELSKHSRSFLGALPVVYISSC